MEKTIGGGSPLASESVGIFRRQEFRSCRWSGGVVEWWSGGVVEWWSDVFMPSSNGRPQRRIGFERNTRAIL
jgi:hypothetical protein